jgi:hypothetical protein
MLAWILSDWNLASVRKIQLKIKGLLRRHCISWLVCHCLCGLDLAAWDFFSVGRIRLEVRRITPYTLHLFFLDGRRALLCYLAAWDFFSVGRIQIEVRRITTYTLHELFGVAEDGKWP